MMTLFEEIVAEVLTEDVNTGKINDAINVLTRLR